MTLQIFDCEQGSSEWAALRAGRPTASEFGSILAKGEGKTRRAYLMRLAGEILTGEPAETFSNGNMERGKILEPEARDLYAFIHDVELQRIGFAVNGDKGCSPDSLVGADGGLEVKTAFPHLLIPLILKDEFPSEHKPQCFGNIWVMEREWWDCAVYWPKLPLFEKRIYRDETYIRNLASEVARFNDELAETVERIRRYGQPYPLKEKLGQSLNILSAG